MDELEETLAARYSERVDGLPEKRLSVGPDVLLGDPTHDVPVVTSDYVQLDAGEIEAVLAVEQHRFVGEQPVYEYTLP